MPYSSGTFSLVAGNPVTTGTTISSTWANNTLNDVATGLSTAMLKDGTQTITANIPMAGFKFTGLGAGAAAGNSLRYEQVFTTGTLALLGSVSASGSLTLGSSLYVGTTATVSGALQVGGRLNTSQTATLTATATVALGAASGNYALVTGTAAVSSFDSLTAGGFAIIRWSGATPLNNNANLILPGGANLTTAANDLSLAVSDGAGVWRLLHQKASGAPILMSPITNAIGADVTCSVTSTFFLGPTIAQGTAGTWFASGSVTLKDTAGAASFRVKLWDGTTVIDSTEVSTSAALNATSAQLSGYITNPVDNIRISVQDISAVSGYILCNQSGAAKDSIVTAIRIA